MADRSESGERDREYVVPGPTGRRWAAALAAAASVAAAIVGVHFAGSPEALSPGPLASVHAALDAQCAQCHERRKGVSPLRCERCHDPGSSLRFDPSEHAALAARSTPSPAAQHPVAGCAACHADHRGREASLRGPDGELCTPCHGFATTNHPEFRAIASGETIRIGLKFTHDRHIADLRKASRPICESCHEPTTGGHGFAPLSFDRHCASCHLKNGAFEQRLERLPADLLTPLPLSGEPHVTASRDVDQQRRLVDIAGVRHRDPWVLDNAVRIRALLDPEGLQADRDLVRKQIDALESSLSSDPLASIRLASPEHSRRALEHSQALAMLQQQFAGTAGAAGPSMTPPAYDPSEVRTSLDKLRQRGALLDRPSIAPRRESSSERQELGATERSLFRPCVTCHELEGSQLPAVSLTRSALPASRFDHAPHVLQLSCDSCHPSVMNSNVATDLNLSGVAGCLSCHRPGRSRSACITCHAYHPGPPRLPESVK